MHNTAVTQSKGQQGSYSEADQILGRYLIDPAEIERLERDECLVLITGLQPFKSKKYDCTKHPRYEEIERRCYEPRQQLRGLLLNVYANGAGVRYGRSFACPAHRGKGEPGSSSPVFPKSLLL